MQRILVGYDGSESARKALDQACFVAKARQCRLTVLTAASEWLVRQDGVVTPAVDEERARRVAEEGAQRARDYGVAEVETRVSVEAPADALARESEDVCDLLVVGHRGLGALQELFLGSTAKSVIDRVPCSVLVAR